MSSTSMSLADRLDEAVQALHEAQTMAIGGRVPQPAQMSVIAGRLNASVERICVIAQSMRDQLDGWQERALLTEYDGTRPDAAISAAAEQLDVFVVRLREALPYGGEFVHTVRRVKVLADLDQH